MNSENGALDFEAVLKTGQLDAAATETEKRIKGMTAAVVNSGQAMDDAFAKATQKAQRTKENIAVIEADIKKLNAQISKLPPGAAKAGLIAESNAAKKALEEEKRALVEYSAQVRETEKTHVSFRTKLREVREELIRMEQGGQRGTDAYRRLQAEAGQLKDAMGDAQAQMAAMANDERGFQAVVSTLSGVTGAFSAAQGAVGLFAGENENLQKIMLKVQSLMAITIGLQQVAQMLNKDSYFSVVLLTQAQSGLAAANGWLATTFGISTVAAQALMATLTLGLSAAITGMVVLLSRLITKQREQKAATDAFNKGVADSAYKQVAVFHQLAAEWDSLADNLEEKNKFITRNADAFDKLGIKINDVRDAENLFINNKDSFVEALILRAKAMASAELAAEKYKEVIEKTLQLSATPEKIKKEEYVTDPETGMLMATYTTETDNEEYTKLKQDRDKLEKEAASLIAQQVTFTAQEKKILEDMGLSSSKVIDGSIEAIELGLNRLKESYKKATNSAERAALLAQIKQQEALLKKVDLLENAKDPSKAVLGTYDKIQEAISETSKALINASEKERPAFQEKLIWLIKQREAWDNLIKAQRGETRDLKPLTLIKPTLASTTVDTKTLGNMKQLTAEQKKFLEAKSDQLFMDNVASENYEKQKEFLQQSVAFLNQSVSKYGEMLGLSEDQQGALQNGLNALEGMAQIASGNVIQGAFTLVTSLVDSLVDKPKKLSEVFEGVNENIQKVINSLDLAEETFSRMGKDASTGSIKVVKAQLLDLADSARDLNAELAKSSTGRRRPTNMNVYDIVEQAADINNEIELLTNRLLKGDISDDQRKAIEALLESYNSLLAKIDATIQDLIGTTVNDLSRSISDAILDGADAWDVWGQKATDIIKNVVSKQLTAKWLTAPITDAVNTLVNDSGNGLSEEEALKFKNTIKGIYEEVAPAYQAAVDSLKAVGIDISAGSEKAKAKTGIAAQATEDTVTAMVGQTMAMRSDLKAIQGINLNISNEVSTLRELAFNQNIILSDCLFEMRRIGKNTEQLSRLENIENSLVSMDSTLKKGLI